jgi:hypothetical protein
VALAEADRLDDHVGTGDEAEEDARRRAARAGDKAEALAVLDDAMLFLRGGIDALQEKQRC